MIQRAKYTVGDVVFVADGRPPDCKATICGVCAGENSSPPSYEVVDENGTITGGYAEGALTLASNASDLFAAMAASFAEQAATHIGAGATGQAQILQAVRKELCLDISEAIGRVARGGSVPAPVPDGFAWRSIKDLPPPSEDDDEMRCVVVWEDAENSPDVGIDTTSMMCIRDGDYDQERMANVVWRALLDAPAFAAPIVPGIDDE